MRLCQCIFALVAAFFPFGRGALTRQAPQEHRSQIISCSSADGEKHYCEADTRDGARLGRQRKRCQDDNVCIRRWPEKSLPGGYQQRREARETTERCEVQRRLLVGTR